MSEPFRYRRPIRWADIDAARIAYTGRIPDMGLEALERFYEERLGVSWFEIGERFGVDTPCVHLEVDFKAPLTDKTVLSIETLLVKVGRTSLHFALSATDEATRVLCWQARFVFACVDLATFTGAPLPAALQPALTAELALADESKAAGA